MYGQWNGHGPACCVKGRIVAVLTIAHNAPAQFKSPRRRQEGLAGVVLGSSLRHGVVQDYVDWKLVVFRGYKGHSRETAKVRGAEDGEMAHNSRRAITLSSVLCNRALRPVASTWTRSREL